MCTESLACRHACCILWEPTADSRCLGGGQLACRLDAALCCAVERASLTPWGLLQLPDAQVCEVNPGGQHAALTLCEDWWPEGSSAAPGCLQQPFSLSQPVARC